MLNQEELNKQVSYVVNLIQEIMNSNNIHVAVISTACLSVVLATLKSAGVDEGRINRLSDGIIALLHEASS